MDKDNKYIVSGMSCAACSARVERAVSSVSGVESCAVNLLTGQMSVTGDAPAEEIIKAVEKAGYGISRSGNGGAKKPESPDKADKADKKTAAVGARLVSSAVLLALLMYVSMGAVMWGLPLPPFMENNYMAIGILQLILTSAVMVINQRFFISGYKALINKSPNMDTLVALGASAAFVYSTYALFRMTGVYTSGGAEQAAHYLHEFYFEAAAMILTLITLGKMLEEHSKGKTTNAIRELAALAPKTASVIRDGAEVTVNAEDVRTGDIFVVRPGESIPADGVVTEGSSAVDESTLTGESVPVDKQAGDTVSAATINRSGFLKCEALRVGEDTALSKIIELVSDASATKAPIAKLADRVSGVFVPAVLAVAALTTVIWLIAGQGAGFALARGISVLVISCPCALGLATPVAIMVGSGIGAKNGIMFKTAASLEYTGKMQIAALDKTGTVTVGSPKVTDIVPLGEAGEEELIKYAYSLEKKSEHPLSSAIVEYAEERAAAAYECEDFEALAGSGLTAAVDGEAVYAGSRKFIGTRVTLTQEAEKTADSLAEEGKTPLFFARGGRLLGIIAVADTVREDSREAIAELKNMGISAVMLTGDNQRTARAVARQAGLDSVMAELLPEDKAAAVAELKKDGRVLMVGDGINDVPALMGADMGIAIGRGTDVAIEAAEVVLVKSRLRDVAAAVRLSRAVIKNIRQNLFWAFCYNVIGIPIAAGALIPLLGIRLSPMIGAAAMSLSSLCVVSNALRLNRIDIYSPSGDKKFGRNKKNININVNVKEKKAMEKIMKIEGMMCGHCEAAVKKALEELPQVEKAEVSHTSGTAVVTLKENADDDLLKNTVEAKDYKVLSIE